MKNQSEASSERDLLELLVPFMGCLPPFVSTASERCSAKGLLPSHLVDYLVVLNLLSFTVLSAQKAQRKYGVRASVLLSMAIDESSFEIRDLVSSPNLIREQEGRRSLSPDIDRWFLNRAKKLATSKAFKDALPCVAVREYIQAICESGFGDPMKALDLWSNIENYHLEDCDRAAMLPIGRYDSALYDQVKDAAGNTLDLVVNPLQLMVRYQASGSPA